jgi:putative SOS response-associated peptidase YedK
MCGRVRLSSDVSEIRLVFGIPPERPLPNVPPSWNVAPTDTLPVVRYDAKAGQRSLDMLRWGLIPYWAKDSRLASPTSTPRRRGSRASRLSAKRLNAGAALCRSTVFTNGRRRKPASSLMRLRSPTAASWRSRAYGKTGAPRPASGFAPSRSSPPRRTNCAPSSTIVCRSC